MDFMTVQEAKKYIKKLGLEKAHNAIKRAVGNGEALFESEAELFMTAYRMVRGYVEKYNRDYRVTLYILRYDGTAQFFYNDADGINGTDKQPFEVVKGYADKFSANEDYMLMVEIKPNRYIFISQM